MASPLGRTELERGSRAANQPEVDHIQEGLFVVGPNGRVHFCNPRLEELAGVKPAQVIGQPYDVLFRELAAISSTESKTKNELLSAAQDVNEQPNIKLHTRYPLDSRLQIKLFPIPQMTDDSVSDKSWGGIILDTTAEWNEITQWTEHLSAVTHSMRSSVATIKGFVSTLLNGHRYWGDSERQSFLENIDDSVDQLSRLLENAQELFKLEIDAVELDRRPTDIKKLLQRVVQSLSFQKNGYSFVLDIPEELPSAEVDTLRIEQVMHNLLDNAAKYSPRDKKIRIHAQLKDGEIHISVSDQGVGIPTEHLSRIFDEFYQVNYGELSRGLGIGLYVARGLILVHGGRIWAENNPAQGTTITFTLPLEPQQAQARPRTAERVVRDAASRQSQSAPGLEMRPNREVAKVLVVDDDPQMLRLLKIKLEVEGFETVTASRGNIVLELVAAEQPDVILLDISLPDSNGFDLCARLREFTAAPIIMITGYAREEDMVRGLDAGADDYLVKPVRSKELIARVRANLRRARVPEQAPNKPIFRTGELLIDFAQRQVTIRNQPVRLTPTEYKLLYHLAANAGRILTHSQLLAKVWGPGYEEDTQYLWVNISRLRGKLEKDPSQPEYILTEPGVGYFIPAQ